MLLLDQLKNGLDVFSLIEDGLFMSPKEDIPSPASSPTSRLPYSAENLPGLQDLVDEMGLLPPCSMVIGACDDRSHLFLDLTDPLPGAVLIVGEANSGKTRLLHAMLASLSVVNLPRHVRYVLISDLDQEVQTIIDQPHCYRHHWPNSPRACDLVVELADLVESRQKTPYNSSAVVLAIDDLAGFLSHLDDETIEQLAWLVANGPEVRVWPIATLRVEDFKQTNNNDTLINSFGTRLVGKIDDSVDPELIEHLCGIKQALPSELQASSQFGVVFGNDWIRFWLPKADYASAKMIAKK